MNYAFLSNGQVEQYPFGINALRKKFPQVSFPKNIATVNLSEYNVVSVQLTDRPTFNERTHYLSEGIPINESGIWKQTWVLTALSTDEIQQHLSDKQENERKKRNRLLKESDWTQLADTTVDKTAWANYRQQLRDLPSQSGFPYTINWPTKP